MNVQLKQMHQFSGNTVFTALFGTFTSYKTGKNIFIVSDDYQKILNMFSKNTIQDGIGKDIELLCSNLKDGNNAEEIKPYCYRLGESNTYVVDTSNMRIEHLERILEFKSENTIIFYDTEILLNDTKINLFFNIISSFINISKEIEDLKSNSYRTLTIFNFFDNKVDKIPILASLYDLRKEACIGVEYNSMIRKYLNQGKGFELVQDILYYKENFIGVHTNFNYIFNYLTKGKLR